MSSKGAFKFQEFEAHIAAVRCLAIGRKSCQVIATGGEDKKVNVWAVGKMQPLLRLTGHTTTVESVAFDVDEEVVVAGAESGTVKLWDLEQAKAIRTLLGHRSPCVSVEFHPFGDFFASGSLDTNLKIWDIRRRSCIQTYKGHSDAVTAIRFSPDGKWVATASKDSTVKVWDLTAGKLLTELQHDGPVSCLDFHPSEFLLATGSDDRIARVWDMDRFSLLSQGTPDSTRISNCKFTPDGSGLLACSDNHVRVWHWEPAGLLDTCEAAWGGVADCVINSSSQLVAGTFTHQIASVWAVNVSSLKPFSGENGSRPAPNPVGAGAVSAIQPGNQSPLRNVQSSVRSPVRQAAAQSPVRNPALAAAAVENASPDSPAISAARRAEEEAQAAAALAAQQLENERKALEQERKRIEELRLEAEKAADQAKKEREETEKLRLERERMQKERLALERRAEDSTREHPKHSVQRHEVPESRSGFPVHDSDSGVVAAPARPPSSVGVNKPRAALVEGSATPAVKTIDLVSGHKLSSLLRCVSSDDGTEVRKAMLQPHETMWELLGTRLEALQAVGGRWAAGEVKESLHMACSYTDDAVLVDMLSLVGKKPGLLSLDAVSVFLPRLHDILRNTHEEYQLVGLQTLQSLAKQFSGGTLANLVHPPSSGFVDLAAEDRAKKALSVVHSMEKLEPALNSLKRKGGRVGPLARAVSASLATVIQSCA